MRSRIAITLMLVFGFGLSSTGAGLAISGIASSEQTAAQAQYGQTPPTTQNTPPANTPPAANPGGGAPEVLDDGEVAGETEDSGSAPEKESGAAPEAAAAPDVQQVRQAGAEEGGEELPFTGFAAIPVLLLGMALMASGFVLRRGSRNGA